MLKVALGVDVFDSDKTPIILILDKSARECIANMAPEAQAICFYNKEVPREEIVKMMEYHVPTKPEDK